MSGFGKYIILGSVVAALLTGQPALALLAGGLYFIFDEWEYDCCCPCHDCDKCDCDEGECGECAGCDN